MILFFMLLVASIIFWLVYRSRKAKNKQLSKTFLISFFIIAGIFVLSAGALDTEIGNAETIQHKKKNDELTEQIEEMSDHQTTLEQSLSELQTDLETEQEVTNKFEEQIKALEKEQQESDKQVEELEQENKDLQERVATKKVEDEKVSAEKKDEEARVAAAEKKEKEVKATASKEKSEQTSPEVATASTDASTNDDCDIKGSQTNIYHVPGSTYYSRTKNVAQWFCSEQAAQNAGYRAPEK